jgi:hypothetical protein
VVRLANTEEIPVGDRIGQFLRHAVPPLAVHLAAVFKALVPGMRVGVATSLRQEAGFLQYAGKTVQFVTGSTVCLNGLDHENCSAGHT